MRLVSGHAMVLLNPDCLAALGRPRPGIRTLFHLRTVLPPPHLALVVKSNECAKTSRVPGGHSSGNGWGPGKGHEQDGGAGKRRKALRNRVEERTHMYCIHTVARQWARLITCGTHLLRTLVACPDYPSSAQIKKLRLWSLSNLPQATERVQASVCAVHLHMADPGQLCICGLLHQSLAPSSTSLSPPAPSSPTALLTTLSSTRKRAECQPEMQFFEYLFSFSRKHWVLCRPRLCCLISSEMLCWFTF